MPEKLIEYWSEFNPEVMQCHPKDTLHPWKTERRVRTIHDLIQSEHFDSPDDTILHLNLLPVPYAGNIKTAEIILLLANPKLSLGDYYLENDPSYRKAHKDTIKQTLDGYEFPFIWLDPRFCWHGGFRYWEGRFKHIFHSLRREGESHYDLLQYVANHVAVVQLLPYRSVSFPGGGIHTTLQSCIEAREFIKRLVSTNERLVIPIRKAAAWDFEKGPNNRSAWLSEKTEVGTKLVDRLRTLRQCRSKATS